MRSERPAHMSCVCPALRDFSQVLVFSEQQSPGRDAGSHPGPLRGLWGDGALSPPPGLQEWCCCFCRTASCPGQAHEQHPAVRRLTCPALWHLCVWLPVPLRPAHHVYRQQSLRVCVAGTTPGTIPDPERPPPRPGAHLSGGSCHSQSELFPWGWFPCSGSALPCKLLSIHMASALRY